ncbi:hypothetical protein CFP56_036103 [Quercus suber]|uniref:Uncharacterized protein n=1 Tax=Quercus suber TaxID=58331 RepID=A0AAW0LQE4_QUESU
MLSSRRTSTTATHKNDFEEERVLVVPSTSSNLCFLLGVVPSFACSNLHHTTHRITPLHKSPELCVELVNVLELPMTKIPLKAWMLWLIGYLSVGMDFETK